MTAAPVAGSISVRKKYLYVLQICPVLLGVCAFELIKRTQNTGFIPSANFDI